MDVARQKELYRAMLQIRLVEERIADLYPEQQMRCPVHLCIGQEAAEAGAALSLRADDYAVSGHRSHGHYLAKGGSLKAMLAEIYGKEAGCVGGKGGSMHLVDMEAGFLGSVPIVGSTIPIGVGAALSAKMRSEDRVVMVFLGDGAAETGVFYESLNFAKLKSLGVVFVCENNLYSVYSPMDVRQPAGRSIADLARAHGIESHSADGNDVEAVYELCQDAVDTARRGAGPVFLEFATYRWREHCGPNFDNAFGYRTEAEFEAWKARDPLRLYAERLLASGDHNQSELDLIASELKTSLDDAVHHAKSSPFPGIEQAPRNVYVEGEA